MAILMDWSNPPKPFLVYAKCGTHGEPELLGRVRRVVSCKQAGAVFLPFSQIRVLPGGSN